MTSANPEVSCIRMGSGPALFGLARFYCTALKGCKSKGAVVVDGRACP